MKPQKYLLPILFASKATIEMLPTAAVINSNMT